MVPLIRRNILFSALSLLFLLAGFLFPGCGYHVRATGETIGINIESIAIPMFTSTSSRLGFEADFTKIIREEFISHSRIPMVSSESAQTVLIGRIHDINTSPLAYELQRQTMGEETSTYEITSSRRLKIALDIKLIDKAKGHVLWHEENMEEKGSFKLGTDPLTTRFNEKQALERIARQLAKRIYMKTMERF
ncbi:MAG: LPS assembly lipoprotein LptE [Pseudomonadota bacterium]